MFLLKLFLFKREAPLLFGFLRFAVFLFIAVFAVLWILSATGCSQAPRQKTRADTELIEAKAAMFRKHNTTTTRALHGLDKVLSGGYPDSRAQLKVRHE